MPTVYYPAILETDPEDSDYGVFFPDLPGCNSAGTTQQEALENATMILQTFVDMSLERGETLPEPSPLDSLEIDSDIHEAARVLVPVNLPTGESKRINIMMDRFLVEAIDRLTNNRSAWISAAAREKLREEEITGAQ